MQHKLKLIIYLTIETELPIEDAMDEITSECSYDFFSTENVTVTDTQWVDTFDSKEETN